MKFTFVIFIMLFILSGCAWTTPGNGQEAVITRYPLLFGHGGLDPTPVTTGRRFIAWTTRSTIVNMQPQRIDLEFDDLMTSDGVPIDFHAVITLQVLDSVKLVRDFSADGNLKNAFTKNLEQPFRTAVRDEVKKHGMNETAITVTASKEIDDRATEHIIRIINEKALPVKLIDLSLGRANPPDSVKHQRVETATQEQRVNTEKQRKLAEDQRKMAEESRAAADAAYNAKMSLTPVQYLELQKIQMQRDVCNKGGCTFLFSNAIPLVNIK